MVVIDSADKAMRGGVAVPIADRQIDYLGANGLVLQDRMSYETNGQVSGFDDQFTELVFTTA